MTDAARPHAVVGGANGAIKRSAESIVSALRARAAPAPGDPVDLAQWLVDACTSSSVKRGSFDAGQDTRGDNHHETTGSRSRLTGRSRVHDDGDDDDGEDVDEENADEQDEDGDTTTRVRTESTLEEELAAVAKALELAKAAVEQLQLRMVLKASEQMDQQEQRDAARDDSKALAKRHSSGELERSSRAGVPLVGARVVSSAASCGKCSRYFSAFQRGRNCATCGHLFCPKCVSRQQVVPSKFGHGDNTVRVCDPCSEWLQRAMDRYFDAVDHIRRGPQEQDEKKSRGHELLPLRVRQRSRGAEQSAQSPKSLHHQRRMEYRAQRHSIAVPDRKAKPWFSGNLRAMHVGDRHARRRSTTEADGDGARADNDGDTDGQDDLEHADSPDLHSDHPSSLPLASVAVVHASRQRATTVSTFVRPPSISIDTSRSVSRRRSLESSDGEEANEDEEAATAIPNAGKLETELKSPILTNVPEELINVTISRARSYSKPAEREAKKKSRKTKYARSASIDFASLSTVCGHPPVSPAASDANESVFSWTGSVSNSELRGSQSSMKKYFDDSDIVDDRRSFVGSSDAGGESEGGSDNRGVETGVDLPATVLRFAVYDVGSKDNQSLKRSIVRFGRKNVLLDRYTLEVDRAQGIVRVKSVFMHRYWAFRCDSVYSVMAVGNGGGAAVARVVLLKNGGHGHQSLEWEFGSHEDRDQFKSVVDELKSRRISPIAGNTLRAESRQMTELNLLTANNLTSEGVVEHRPQATTSGLEHDDEPIGSLFPLLPGEVKVLQEDLPVTLIIGPTVDSSTPVGETAAVWGRMRGFAVVTNYRVIFIHLSEQCQSFHRATAVAYIPLFAIISSQVVFAGGRRPRSTRAFQSTAPPIVVISCKDARAMHLEIEGPPQIADDLGQNLQNTINRMADAAQRYRAVKPIEQPSSPSMTLEGFEIGERVPGSLSDQYVRDSMPPATNIGGAGSTNVSPRSTSAFDSSLLSPAFLPSSSASVASPVVQPLNPSSSERSDTFAFFYSIGSVRSIPDDINGWKIYTEDREFRRQIIADPVAQPFLKFYQNTRGNVCKSYPAKLLVPSSMTSSTLMKVAEFRAKNRLPVITYYHQRNRCVLVRSGQPLLGNLLSGSSSLSDQLLLGVYRRFPEIIRTQSQAAPSSRPIYIFDARKLKASTGNRLMGKGGVETPQDYPGAVVHHLNIANMYRMQSSYQALVKLVLPGGVDDQDKAWLSSLEATRWLSHVRQVLDGAVKIARVLELEGSSALVHCSDGWDRTAQLTSLAQIMIDPFYRTIRGFAVVVEKDWCSFGHKFAERLGGDRNKDPQRSKSSPVMFQFLDAVWQMLRQFPTAFEFDERFLLHIANSLTSGLYGTFLYDTRFDRDANDVKNCTVSVWTPVLMTPDAFQNPDYKPLDTPIWPWTSTQMVRLWEAYFFQWHSKFHGCRWSASLIHHHHHQNNPNGYTNGSKGDDLHPRSSSTHRSASIDDTGLSSTTPTSQQPSSSSSGAAREREGSGELHASRSFRLQQADKKPPPMHKIFLFKS